MLEIWVNRVKSQKVGGSIKEEMFVFANTLSMLYWKCQLKRKQEWGFNFHEMHIDMHILSEQIKSFAYKITTPIPLQKKKKK